MLLISNFQVRLLTYQRSASPTGRARLLPSLNAADCPARQEPRPPKFATRGEGYLARFVVCGSEFIGGIVGVKQLLVKLRSSLHDRDFRRRAGSGLRRKRRLGHSPA